ncbi:MAG: tRNA uridine-5-carboxymethylaminomethyl(34) synthesis GTPase MnmE [Kiritimatiellae bacterium]|nr:tRNA uridine-5-carboxymethylaminomethyl(34) synthesis GTPase MnmE [Kiritimatiellia bacterium]MCO5068609.1 tRNA uridine-5-carboxymethylaminomethyl(34) synthesis GTPase MnmE [Kiritimatiellia bacterium]
MASDFDTIAAIATAPGEGGVAIIRISGPRCFEIADAVFSCPEPPPSQRAAGTFVYGRVIEADGVPLDDALLLIMRAPRSYTREDTVEIQGHGGPIVARRILQRVLDQGARSAEPGEFTKRAFLNGRLDLTQAEAVLDLIRARSDRAAAAALDQLEGALSRRINALYDRLLGVAGNLEATLDFSDQEIPPNVLDPTIDELDACLADINALLATWNEGHLLREGATVVIAGKPNVGKSTLLNALVGRDRAIVSDQPGTTRDTIEETLVLGGYPLILVDTAGIRETACGVEREGIRRTEQELAEADICLYLIEAEKGPDPEDRALLAKLDPRKTIVVANKSDKTVSICAADVCVSSLTGDGLGSLRAELVRRLDTGAPHSIQHASISTRHKSLLAAAREDAAAALVGLRDASSARPLDLIAAQLRDALEDLGLITGRVYHDALLDTIFSRFCIGK